MNNEELEDNRSVYQLTLCPLLVRRPANHSVAVKVVQQWCSLPGELGRRWCYTSEITPEAFRPQLRPTWASSWGALFGGWLSRHPSIQVVTGLGTINTGCEFKQVKVFQRESTTADQPALATCDVAMATQQGRATSFRPTAVWIFFFLLLEVPPFVP